MHAPATQPGNVWGRAQPSNQERVCNAVRRPEWMGFQQTALVLVFGCSKPGRRLTCRTTTPRVVSWISLAAASGKCDGGSLNTVPRAASPPASRQASRTSLPSRRAVCTMALWNTDKNLSDATRWANQANPFTQPSAPRGNMTRADVHQPVELGNGPPIGCHPVQEEAYFASCVFPETFQKAAGWPPRLPPSPGGGRRR